MNAHDLAVILTGLLFLADAAVALAIWRLLGVTFHTKTTAPWPVRGFFFAAVFVLGWRSLSLLFPGAAMQTNLMSPAVPATAAVVLGLEVFILDVVMRDRAPPPLVERLLQLVQRQGADADTIAAVAFAAPVPDHVLPGEVSRCSRGERVVVLAICALVLVGVGLALALAAGR